MLTPSETSAINLAAQAIDFETRGTLYRFTCRTCNRVGCWLEKPEVVRKNAERHALAHANGEI